VHGLYAAENRYALSGRSELRPGQRFALRAVIELHGPAPRKEVRWRVLDADGNSLEAFERTDASPGLTGKRIAFVEGEVPANLLPGAYTLEVAVSTPDRAPVVRRASLSVVQAPLAVESVVLSPSQGEAVGVATAAAGVRLFLHTIYRAGDAVAAGVRRLSWQVADARGRPIPQLAGTRRVKGKRPGRFAFVEPMQLPEDMPAGTYWFRFSVTADGERADGRVIVEVRQP
jgi:hypothetical protein